MKKKIGLILIGCLGLTVGLAKADHALYGETVTARLKDIGKIVEVRENQLMGFGLVVGLRNSGDSKESLFTNQAFTTMLAKLGIDPGPKAYSSRNVAAVMVTATLPPFVKPGQRIAVNVSSIGDSRSLEGGTLILTPLKGPDGQVYAVAQGSVVVGGVSAHAKGVTYVQNQTTVGRITEGAIVERAVPITLVNRQQLTIVLNDSNFVTASRTAKAIQNAGFTGAKAADANTILVPVGNQSDSAVVDIIAKLENVEVAPDNTSKIVINSRTGTVVIGEMVRLFPVALTHGNIAIKISEADEMANGFYDAASDQGNSVKVVEAPVKVVFLNPSATLNSLVGALNQIGATPKDLISILQALKESGALIGTIEII